VISSPLAFIAFLAPDPSRAPSSSPSSARSPNELSLPAANLSAHAGNGRLRVRGKREVRYVVSRLEDPDDPESGRHPIGCYPYFDLAKREADRVAPGSCVDAEGGTYSSDGTHARYTQWQADWINLNIYQGRERRRHAPEIYD